MADYNKFDPRIDSLVVETRTVFADDVKGLPEEDRKWLAAAIHKHPEIARKISYERTHTGFIREVLVAADDVARLYDIKVHR
jgi:hypothetical protein